MMKVYHDGNGETREETIPVFLRGTAKKTGRDREKTAKNA